MLDFVRTEWCEKIPQTPYVSFRTTGEGPVGTRLRSTALRLSVHDGPSGRGCKKTHPNEG